MARVTPIRTPSQAEYRLREECGQDRAAQRDRQADYRLTGGRPVERIGSGWGALGREAGPMDAAGVEDMRALLAGAHPDTGEQLVKAKTKTSPKAKLPAAPMLAEMRAQGVKVKRESWTGRRVGRMLRGVAKDPEHAVSIKDLEKLSRATGVDLAQAYPAADLKRAREHAQERTVARVRAWEVALDTPKDVGTLWALGGPDVRASVERAHMAAVRDTVETAEEWTAYGQRGAQGGGQVARRVGTHGLLGSVAVHTTARPVGGISDPHIHAHVMLANLSQGVDGQWGAIAAGGRELHRAVPALGELHRARLREHMTAKLGVVWEQDARGQWAIQGVPQGLRDLYSRRRDQAVSGAGEGASAPERRAAARRTVEPKDERGEDAQRREWADRARAAGYDPHAVVAAATGHAQEHGHEDQEARADRVAAQVWRAQPVTGISHPHLIAAAARHAPTTTRQEAEATAHAVAARSERAGGTAGGAQLRHADRWQAPRITAQQARTGQGPVTAAARRDVADLRSAGREARGREDAARERLADLARLEERGAVAVWRAGMTRAQVRADRDRVERELEAARREVTRAQDAIRAALTDGARGDVTIATAQEKAREALREVRQRARRREALRQMAPSRPDEHAQDEHAQDHEQDHEQTTPRPSTPRPTRKGRLQPPHRVPPARSRWITQHRPDEGPKGPQGPSPGGPSL